ncbi:hypothetical protein VNO77_34875 [Canavalia gladiata]|uniref:Uncharacterized protein n=1 Tax=Canavalia gladiata TaxID=3824 RepID=A0AAN9Q218_CANGL
MDESLLHNIGLYPESTLDPAGDAVRPARVGYFSQGCKILHEHGVLLLEVARSGAYEQTFGNSIESHWNQASLTIRVHDQHSSHAKPNLLIPVFSDTPTSLMPCMQHVWPNGGCGWPTFFYRCRPFPYEMEPLITGAFTLMVDRAAKLTLGSQWIMGSPMHLTLFLEISSNWVSRSTWQGSYSNGKNPLLMRIHSINQEMIAAANTTLADTYECILNLFNRTVSKTTSTTSIAKKIPLIHYQPVITDSSYHLPKSRILL